MGIFVSTQTRLRILTFVAAKKRIATLALAMDIMSYANALQDTSGKGAKPASLCSSCDEEGETAYIL